MQPAAVDEQWVATATGAIVVDAARLPQADDGLFAAAAAGQGGEHGRGGRGAVWFVETPVGPAVLRHYRRGGLVARFSRDSYLWAGAERTRSVAEFRLLAEMRRRGLPVPAPLAARYQRLGLLRYRADILMSRIEHAHSLAELLPAVLHDSTSLRELGRTLARFHGEGVCHADLNAHNVLRDDDGQWWLIDFDRGQQRAPAPGWWASRLRRLQRSLDKLGAFATPEGTAAWHHLRDAHDTAVSA